MVLAFFLAQYLYSDIFVTRFPEPAELAVFLGVYFAITNALEIVCEVAVTPRLIRRVGVPGANLIHPGLMILSFGGLALRYGLPAGVAARAAKEMMDNAMALPIRSLVQNAMPARFRGRMRAFLEGIVVYAGMSVAGIVLLLVHEPDPPCRSPASCCSWCGSRIPAGCVPRVPLPPRSTCSPTGGRAAPTCRPWWISSEPAACSSPT
jgi:hypothetical protein